MITDILGHAIQGGYQNTVFIAMVVAVAASVILEITLMRPRTADMTDELIQEEYAIEEQAKNNGKMEIPGI